MVRKKSPRSNDPYAKAKETINQNETAIKAILEQNSEPYLREQSKLFRKLHRESKNDPTTTSPDEIEEVKVGHNLLKAVERRRLIIKKAQDSINKLNSSPTSVTDIQSNILEP